MPARTIAIGDIHGCSRALEALIAAIEPRRDDVIVTLGDYVNRGPDTRGVIERIIALQSQCVLVPILGNHDQLLLEAHEGSAGALALWLRLGGGPTLWSYGIAAVSKRVDFGRIPFEHLGLLRRCQSYHETDTNIFVHAQYAPNLPMERQPIRVLRWESLRDTIPAPHISGKPVIAGHTSQKSGEILDLGHLVCIDTYCYGGGWLTALDVHTRQVWQVSHRGDLRLQ
jgi:serine/threonine protein phosphatase 1